MVLEGIDFTPGHSFSFCPGGEKASERDANCFAGHTKWSIFNTIVEPDRSPQKTCFFQFSLCGSADHITCDESFLSFLQLGKLLTTQFSVGGLDHPLKEGTGMEGRDLCFCWLVDPCKRAPTRAFDHSFRRDMGRLTNMSKATWGSLLFPISFPNTAAYFALGLCALISVV